MAKNEAKKAESVVAAEASGLEPLRSFRQGGIARAKIVEVLKEFDAQPEAEAMLELNEHNLSDEEGEVLAEYLLGKALLDKVALLASGRGVSVLLCVRQGVRLALNIGGFVIDSTAKKTPRTGNDENVQVAVNRRITALLGAEECQRVKDIAREHKVSNLCALQLGVQAALDRMAF